MLSLLVANKKRPRKAASTSYPRSFTMLSFILKRIGIS